MEGWTLTRYVVAWEMFGTAYVEADSPKEAQDIVSDGCMDWSGDIDWDSADIAGADVQQAEEI